MGCIFVEIEDVRRTTTLEAKYVPDARYDFLRCQLGLWESVKVQTSPYRTITEKVWRLKAFGVSWDAAFAMWKKI